VHGNVIAVRNEGAPVRVMLAGHCDEIGFMLTHIDGEGFLSFQAIGGVDPAVVPGMRVLVHDERGAVRGVIGRKPIHLLKEEERGKGVKLESLWIDIGAKNKKDAEKCVAVGGVATFDVGFDELRNDVVVARGFDDRVGSFVVVETMRLLSRRRPQAAVYAVSTVQEEIGLRGARTSAFGIDPHVGIAVDVGFASDYPGADKKEVGDVKLGGGPILHVGPNINPVVARLMAKAAKQARIKTQMQAEPRATGTDANAIQVTRSGVAAGLVSIPNRYMHTPVEAVHLRDLENAAKLLAEFVMMLTPRTSFIPR
jgi:endoglucanase